MLLTASSFCNSKRLSAQDSSSRGQTFVALRSLALIGTSPSGLDGVHFCWDFLAWLDVNVASALSVGSLI